VGKGGGGREMEWGGEVGRGGEGRGGSGVRREMVGWEGGLQRQEMGGGGSRKGCVIWLEGPLHFYFFIGMSAKPRLIL